MKLAVCNEFFEGWEIGDVFAFAKEVGFDAVEIAPYTLADSVEQIQASERERIRKAADDCGVEIVGLHWLFVKPEGLHLTRPDEAARQKTRDYLLELTRFCADIGGRLMVIGSPQQRNIEEGVEYRQGFEWAADAFKDAADLAGELDVMLCFEPLNSNITNFIRNPDEALELIKAVDHPNFQMIVDVCSSSIERLDIPAEIRKHAPHIRHIHANDDNLYVPGSGGADYPPIIQALKEVGYDGYLSVEVFKFEPDPKTIAPASCHFLKQMLSQYA